MKQLMEEETADGTWSWLPNFTDNTFPRVIALGNCATGKTNWLSKGLETQPGYFWDFFTRSPITRNVCLTFIAVPFMMTDNEKRRKLSPECITFDRIRICEHAALTSSSVMQWLEHHRAEALDVALL